MQNAADEGFDWDDVLLRLRERGVVPVVGRELLTLNGNPPELLDHRLARELAKELKVALPAGLDRPSVADVAFLHLAEIKKRTSNALYSKLKLVLDRVVPQWPMPEPLSQLASITDFPLFVTTTTDGLLQRAVTSVSRGTSNHAFSLRAPVEDLSTSDLLSAGRSVYNLFGRASAFPDYAVTEEDILEFICTLQSPKRPARLFDVLAQNDLLFLGVGFPDWLARFFIRTMSAERLSAGRDNLDVLVDARICQDGGLVVFLRQYEKAVVAGLSTTDFVQELHRRWSEGQDRQVPVSPPHVRPMASGDVFISYAREDRDVVQQIVATLEAEDIGVWVDDQELQAGENWQRTIDRNIGSASLFVPVLSRNTKNIAEGYFRREWNRAAERAERFRPDVVFILPVVIDSEVQYGAGDLPAAFEKAQWLRTDDGRLSKDALARIKTCQRQSIVARTR
jgi:TIR domain/SIR2-like domain